MRHTRCWEVRRISQEGLSRCKHFPGKECTGEDWGWATEATVSWSKLKKRKKENHPRIRTAFLVKLKQSLAAPLSPLWRHPTWAGEAQGTVRAPRRRGEAARAGPAAERRRQPWMPRWAHSARRLPLAAHRRGSGGQIWELSSKRLGSIL